jgi:hypothetical protein
MTTEGDHRKRADTPSDDVQRAHARSSRHRAEILESEICGCFYCCAVFPPERIEEWVDPAGSEGQTALCPDCGIDSVIGDASGFPITRAFLEKMNRHWF